MVSTYERVCNLIKYQNTTFIKAGHCKSDKCQHMECNISITCVCEWLRVCGKSINDKWIGCKSQQTLWNRILVRWSYCKMRKNRNGMNYVCILWYSATRNVFIGMRCQIATKLGKKICRLSVINTKRARWFNVLPVGL